MNKTLLESQGGVLYFTSLVLSMVSAISSVASHSVQNPQTLQRFLSPLVVTPPMVGSTWSRVRSTLESDCLPVLFQGTALFHLVVD